MPPRLLLGTPSGAGAAFGRDIRRPPPLQQHSQRLLPASRSPRVYLNEQDATNAWEAAADKQLSALKARRKRDDNPAAWAAWDQQVREELQAHHSLATAEQQNDTAEAPQPSGGQRDAHDDDGGEWASTPARIGDPVILDPMYIRSFDLLPAVALDCFPASHYCVSTNDDSTTDDGAQPACIMVQQHQLKDEEVPESVCCVSRFGSGGFANVPIGDMSDRGIPVFTTPSSNSNAVKEAVVCALFLASRGILEGAAHYRDVILRQENTFDAIEARVEEDAWMFTGAELEGKTLGVIGLGNVGSRVAAAALDLGMRVVGYDPWLTSDSILRLPGDQMMRAPSLEALLRTSDFVSIHVTYFNIATHHLLNSSNLGLCKPGVHLINFSPPHLIDGEAVLDLWQRGRLRGKYVSDFADPVLQGHPRHLVLPHIGALTHEAQLNSAVTAADAVSAFLETGAIRHSVNFPALQLQISEDSVANGRMCIVVQSDNEPGVLGQVDTFLEQHGVRIEAQVAATKGVLAYLLLDVYNVRDPAALQVELARNVRRVISSRYIDFSSRGVPRSTFAVSRHIWEHEDEADFEIADWGSTLCSEAEGTQCDANVSKADCMTETWPDSS